MKILSLLFVFLTPVITVFTGIVVKITYGDTIVVLTEKKEQIKIRLEGIGCPESKQDFGNKAKQQANNKDEELAKLEQEASKHKIGLWSQPYPVAPWDFRRK